MPPPRHAQASTQRAHHTQSGTNGGIRWVAIPLILATSQATTSHIFFKPKPKLWSFGRFDHGRELHLAADGSSSNRMHSSSKHLLRILDMKQIGTKHTFWEPNAIICEGIPSCLHTSLLRQHVEYV